MAVALSAGAMATFGGGAAGADPGSFAGSGDEPAAIGPTPAVVRWMRAVAVCSEIYPPGTDISACIAHLF
jgi:hypothetical protein